MTCGVCKTKGHNKRRCPNRVVVQNQGPTVEEPPQKKVRGIPRTAMQPTLPMTSTDAMHLNATAQPTTLGRGGRTIRGRRGAIGGGSNSTKGRRGARGGGTSSRGGRGSKTNSREEGEVGPPLGEEEQPLGEEGEAIL